MTSSLSFSFSLRLLGVAGWLLFAVSSAQATTLPDYLTQALTCLTSDAPHGWAYTVATTRDDEHSVERYDPSRPKGGEWTLIERNGRAPDADEIQRYLRYKASNAPATARASFQKGDIDVGSLALQREENGLAVFRGRFREDAGEPLLAHVVLDLTVDPARASVVEAVLRLAAPFSPALGVRMHELTLTMTFKEAADGSVVLPHTAHSRFRGRLFFLVPIEEEMRIAYSDFVRVTPRR